MAKLNSLTMSYKPVLYTSGCNVQDIMCQGGPPGASVQLFMSLLVID
jgi:hypothetical protein